MLRLLIVGITLLAVAVAIFLSNHTYRETREMAIEQFHQQELILARWAASGIKDFIGHLKDDLLALSGFPVVQRMEPGTLETMKLLSTGIHHSQTSYRRLDRNGILRFVSCKKRSRKELIGRDYGKEAYFQKARETGEVVISGLLTNDIGERRIRVVRPVYVEDKNGGREFNGVIIGSFDPATLNDLFIAPIATARTGYAWLLDHNGRILAHYEEGFVGRNAIEARHERNPDIDYKALECIQGRMMAGEEGIGSYVSGWHRGQTGKIDKLVAYTPIRLSNHIWSLAVCTPVSEVEEAIRIIKRSELYTLGFVILALVLGGGFFLLTSYQWSRSLEREVAIRTGELKETRDYLNNLIRHANAPIIVWDPEGRVTIFNEAFEKMSGRSEAEMMGETVDALFPEESRPESMQKILGASKGEHWQAVEIPILRKDGEIRIGMWNSANIHDKDGKLIATIAQGQDISERKLTEEALHREKERFRVLVEESPLGISLLGKYNRYKYINPKFIEMFGYSQEEIPTGREWFRKAFPDPEYRHELIAIWKSDFEKSRLGESRSRVFNVRCKDGTEKVIHFRPVTMEGGDQFITHSDITEIRRDAQRLKELERAIEQASEGIATADLERKFVFVNTAWARMHGYQVVDLIGKPVAMLDSPADGKELPRVWEEIMKEGLWQGELQRIRKDGSTFSAVMTSSLVKDDEDMPVGVIGTCQDISAHRQAEEAMRQTEERYRVLFETAKDAIFLTDESGRFADVNPAACESLGYSREELLGLRNNDIDADPRGYEAFMKVKDDQESAITFEVNQRRKDGTLLPVEITGSFFTAGGKALSLAIARDLSNRRYLEAQLRQSQKMEAIGTLTGGVAHDFNNILSAVIGNAELALMNIEKEDPLCKHLDEIRRSAGRAANLIRQLLLFSRRQPMDMVPLSLTSLIRNLGKMLDRLIGEDISLDLDLKPETWSIEGDAGTIEQVIVNMVVNARDAMPEGGEITIWSRNVHVGQEYCTSHTYARPGKFVRLSVRDNGTGMDQAVIDHIFEPFFTTKEVGKGTGLGLSVVYGIVKQHKGWIDLESSPGKGAIFHVYLPAVSVKSEEKEEAPVTLEAFIGRGERILLVEDDKALAEIAYNALSTKGYKVFVAENVQEALHLFKKEGGKFDLIFCDVVLPDGKGPKLVEEFLEIRPGAGVLFTSGYVDEKSSWSAIKESGYPYLQKPYSLTDLFTAIKDGLKKK